ncbi:MAG: hypothetical protein CBD29_06970 [Synechococcus sp. TMED169]|jgi:hypothetical protein|nr:MAG: hypothetical protein CBD29_06970 [Synechococcus sp. TMED169]
MRASLTFGTVRQDLEAERRRNSLELIGLRPLVNEGSCHPKLQQRLENRLEDLESRQRELERIRALLR